jgi:broad specificity phosphatase PhoE
MASIYLIRHGQASFGSDDYDRLSPLGSRQAEVTGWYLRDQGVHFDAVYSGTLKRQQDTARAVCASQPGQCPLTVDVRFNEIDNDEQLKYLLPIVAERNPSIRALMKKGLSASKDYQKVIDAVFNYWVSQECDEPRIQSWADYSSDVRQALEDVISAQGRGKTIGIFSSGGTIATVDAQVRGLVG